MPAICRHFLRDRRVRQMIRAEIEQGSVVVIPPLAVIQARAEGLGRRAIDEVIAASNLAPVDGPRIELAAQLLNQTGTRDLADALVVAEALLRGASHRDHKRSDRHQASARYRSSIVSG